MMFFQLFARACVGLFAIFGVSSVHAVSLEFKGASVGVSYNEYMKNLEIDVESEIKDGYDFDSLPGRDLEHAESNYVDSINVFYTILDDYSKDTYQVNYSGGYADGYGVMHSERHMYNGTITASDLTTQISDKYGDPSCEFIWDETFHHRTVWAFDEEANITSLTPRECVTHFNYVYFSDVQDSIGSELAERYFPLNSDVAGIIALEHSDDPVVHQYKLLMIDVAALSEFQSANSFD